MTKFPEGGPKLLWKASIGRGYAGPAVAGGKAFLFDRTVPDPSKLPKDAFAKAEIAGQENLVCLNAKDGALLWRKSYDCVYTMSYAAGPRCTPTVDGDRVYTYGGESDLRCWRVEDGELLWSKNLKAELKVETPVWGFAAAPLIDGDQIVCLARGEGSTVVSFDKVSGQEKWRALSAQEPGYCPPSMIEFQGKRMLIIWHPESINALEPKTGKLLWSVPWKIKMGLSVSMPRLAADKLFLTSFYSGSTLLRLKPEGAPEVVWQSDSRTTEKRNEHLNSIIPTPIIQDGHVYGVCSYGQLRCLRLEDGKRLWESLKPVVGKEERWANAFLTPHKDRFFLFNELGELILSKLSPAGYEEIGRASLIEPNGSDMRQRPIVWSPPAFAQRCIFVRNDSEARCYSLAADPS